MAVGGGFELALACDFLVVETSATLFSVEVMGGMLPGAGGIQRIADRLGRARTIRMMMLAEPISGEQAGALGVPGAFWRAGIDDFAGVRDLSSAFAGDAGARIDRHRGTGAVWYGSPQWQIEAMRRLEIPEDMQKKYGFAPLGEANGCDQAGYLRFEPPRLYRLNLKAADASPMPAYSADRLAQLKKEYEFAATEPSNLRYGYVRAG
jgi:enoyl-CoA hydratase/carnithine racemase